MRILGTVVAVAVLAGGVSAVWPTGHPAASPVAPDTPRGVGQPSDDAQVRGTLVFQSDRDGRPAIYTIDIASRRVTRLSGSPQWTEGTPRWSPDGRLVAFMSNRAHYEGPQPEPGTPDFDLYVVNADGTGRRRVTNAPANEVDPSWAPDGRSLYYSSDQDSRGDIYRVWLGTGRVDRLTRQFVGRAIMPNASPRGTQVAFAAQTLRLGQFWAYQVHLLDVARGTTQPVAATSGACWPSWSHDAARLANVRLVEGRPSTIEVRDVATNRVTTLVDDTVMWSYYPDWSPDDRHLAFSTSPAHHEGEDWDLALVDVASGRVTRLTSGPGNDRLPDWKP